MLLHQKLLIQSLQKRLPLPQSFDRSLVYHGLMLLLQVSFIISHFIFVNKLIYVLFVQPIGKVYIAMHACPYSGLTATELEVEWRLTY